MGWRECCTMAGAPFPQPSFAHSEMRARDLRPLVAWLPLLDDSSLSNQSDPRRSSQSPCGHWSQGHTGFVVPVALSVQPLSSSKVQQRQYIAHQQGFSSTSLCSITYSTARLACWSPYIPPERGSSDKHACRRCLSHAQRR